MTLPVKSDGQEFSAAEYNHMREQLPPIFDGRGYGVLANGSADDRPAVLDAMAACSDAGGGAVILPPGTIKCFGNLPVVSNVTLRGCGENATTLDMTSLAAGTEAVSLTGATGAAVEHLRILANGLESGTGGGVSITGSTDCHARNVRVDNANIGIRVSGSSSRIRVGDCRIVTPVGTAVGGYGVLVAVSQEVMVTGTHVNGAGRHSIYLSDSSSRCLVRGNIFKSSGLASINVFANDGDTSDNFGHTISENIVETSGGAGILLQNNNTGAIQMYNHAIRGNYISDAALEGILVSSQERVRVQGNHVVRAGTNGIVCKESSVSNKGSNYHSVSDNIVEDNGAGGFGIYFEKTNYSALTKNIVEGAASDGIRVANTSIHNVVSGNISKGNLRGIRIFGSTVLDTIVSDNQCIGNSTAQIEDTGTRTISFGNKEDATSLSFVAGGAEFNSTLQAVRLPRMTTAQRDALANVADGDTIYNTTTGKFQGRSIGAWADLH